MGSIRGDTQYRDLAIKQLTDLTIRSRSELPLAQSGQAHYLGSKKDAVLDGDCRQLKMLPFAKLAQSAGGIICCFARNAGHVATSCSILSHRSNVDGVTLYV